jgi:hypothetical protein
MPVTDILAKWSNVIQEINMPPTPKPDDLTWEHQAIRKQMKFLTNSWGDLASQSSQGIAKSNKLKDQITIYRWSLYDFREAVRRHIDVDERLFENLPSSTSSEELPGEHEIIQKLLDKAISLAEDAVYNKLSEEDLNKCASDIKKAVDRISELISAHTAKEDMLLKQAQKES